MEVVVTEDQESSEGEEKRDEKKNRTAPQWESKLKNLLGKPFWSDRGRSSRGDHSPFFMIDMFWQEKKRKR